MSPAIIGTLGIVILVLLFLSRVPVAFAMGIMGFVGFSYLTSLSAGMDMIAIDMFQVFSSYNLTVVPMFVLMGCLAFRIGMSKTIFDASYVVLGNMRGGLTIASILGSAAFSAICGSTSATAAAMGTVALPQMKRYKYDDSLATGTCCLGGDSWYPHSSECTAHYIRNYHRAIHRQAFCCRVAARFTARFCLYRHDLHHLLP